MEQHGVTKITTIDWKRRKITNYSETMKKKKKKKISQTYHSHNDEFLK